MITTVFCAYWDFRWDWGLFIGTQPGRKYLRNDITFSPAFYYFAMTMNLVFRFWWLIGMFIKMGVESVESESPLYYNIEIMAFVGMMTEAVRRTIWAMIRIENEFFNNFEEYRDIIVIPPI